MVKGASNGTYVGGNIRWDTTWTKENSPYILDDYLRVPRGVELRISEGVVVDFSVWSITVEGSLRAVGKPGESILFNINEIPLSNYRDARIIFTEDSVPWDEDDNLESCLLQHVDILCGNYTVSYGVIKGGAPKIDHCTIHGPKKSYSNYFAVESDGVVSNCVFEGVSKGILMDEGVITDNRFLGTLHGTTIIIDDGYVAGNYLEGGVRGITVKNALVFNNTIINMEKKGINAVSDQTPYWKGVLSPVIAQNIIMGCGEAAIAISGDIRPRIRYNLILENMHGIYFSDDAFYGGKTPRIEYNLFYNNKYHVYSDREDPRIEVDLSYNWWATNETAVIDAKIHDEKDDARLCKVLYTPLLSEPPRWHPKIPYELVVESLPPEKTYNETIEVAGRVVPPLQSFTIQIKCHGPNGESIHREVNTDKDGCFSCEIKPSSVGPWSVTVSPEAYTVFETASTESTVFNVKKIQCKLDYSLSSEAYFEGDTVSIFGRIDPRIRDERITVAVSYPDGLRLQWYSQTDAEGGFEHTLSDSGYGDYSVTFSWPGDDVHQGFSETLDFRIYRSSGLTIITEDAPGFPISSVSFESILKPPGQCTLVGTTDVNGTSIFSRVLPGDYTIRFEKENHETKTVSSHVPEGEVKWVILKLDKINSTQQATTPVGDSGSKSDNPLILGFIPSIIVMVLLPTLYLAIHRLNKQRQRVLPRRSLHGQLYQSTTLNT